MDKRWLSRLLSDSAFPMLALAVAVSQVKVEPYKKSNVLHRENQPTQLSVNCYSE
jgi:hypothetical protein